MSVSTTANLGLTLPYQTDPVAVSEQNSNMGLIDGFAGDEWANMGIVETGDTATHAIAAGQYVIWKGLLYTADSAISVGTTLSRGGSGSSGTKNLTAVSNGGFNALNSNISRESIPANSDFNSYTLASGSPDKHYVGNNLGSITNRPSDIASSENIPYALDVISLNGYTTQVLIAYGSVIRTFQRNQTYTGGAVQWSAWDSYALKSEITSVVDGPTLDVPANTPTDFSPTPPTGYTKGLFLGLSTWGAWTSTSVITVISSNGNYPDRIRVKSDTAQKIRVNIMWFK